MKPIGQHGCNVAQSHKTQIYTNIYIYIWYNFFSRSVHVGISFDEPNVGKLVTYDSRSVEIQDGLRWIPILIVEFGFLVKTKQLKIPGTKSQSDSMTMRFARNGSWFLLLDSILTSFMGTPTMIPNGDKGSARQSSSSLVLWSVRGSQGVSLHVVKSLGEGVKHRWNEVNNETYI